MKNCSFKILVALFTFSIGVAGVWSIGGFSYLASRFDMDSSVPEEPTPIKQTTLVDNSGKIELRFKEFSKDSPDSPDVAEFELFNGTSKPIRYPGYSKNSPCTIVLKHEGQRVRHGICGCGTGVELRTIESGETTHYSVHFNIQGWLNLVFNKQVEQADLGLVIFVGAEKRKEILLIEEIKFPKRPFSGRSK